MYLFRMIINVFRVWRMRLPSKNSLKNYTNDFFNCFTSNWKMYLLHCVLFFEGLTYLSTNKVSSSKNYSIWKIVAYLVSLNVLHGKCRLQFSRVAKTFSVIIGRGKKNVWFLLCTRFHFLTPFCNCLWHHSSDFPATVWW